MKLKAPHLFCQKALINGEWSFAKDSKTIDVLNPFDGTKIGTIPDLSTDEVKDAIAFATKAQSAWANKSAHERADILHAWADLIDAHADDLALIMTLEQGKPLKEAKGEIGYANSFIRFFAEEGKRVYGDTIPAKSAHQRHLVLKQPIEVCACITEKYEL